jgi:hypothetical protein
MPNAVIYATYAKSGTSSYNSNYVFVGQGTSGYWACLGFDLSSLANATITSFKLYLNSATPSSSNLTQSVTFRAANTNAWNAPFIVGAATTSTKVSGSTRAYVWDLTSKTAVLEALQGLGPGAYLHLVETGGTRQMQYEDLAEGSSRPRIEVVYTLNRSTFTLDKSTVEAGSAIAMTISPADATYTHEATWSIGAYSVTQSLDAGEEETSLTIPMAWLNAIPSATSGTASVVLRTYQSGVEIGSLSSSFTITVPSSVVPTVTSLDVTRLDVTVPSAWGIYVQSKSRASMSVVGAAGAYGSTIASYSISGGGYSSATSSLTTGTLMGSGEITFTAIITDTRGRTATATASITVHAYEGPYFTALSVTRCDSDGDANITGEYIRIHPSFTFSNVCDNTVSCVVRWRQGTSGTLSSPTTLTSGVATVIGGGNISAESMYQAVFTLSDTFATVARVETISSAMYSMFIRRDGRGVSFGKASPPQDTVEINSSWALVAGGKDLTALTASDIGAADESHTHGLNTTDVTGVLPITKGGTGADNKATALANLGIQYGVTSKYTVPANSTLDAEITFPVAYATGVVPFVVAGSQSDASNINNGSLFMTVIKASITNTGFSVRFWGNSANNKEHAVAWFSIG